MRRERVRPLRGAWKAGAMICASALLAAPSAEAAKCKVTALELPVTMVGSRAIVRLGINGTEVPLMLDTGAFYSFLTTAAAEQLKLRTAPVTSGVEVLGLTGKVDVRQTTVSHLTLASGELQRVEFLVGSNEPGGGAMGILGRNLLSSVDSEFDLAHGVMRLMPTEGDCGDVDMAYWAHGRPVSVLDLERDSRGRQPAIEAEVRVNGRKVRALFDTGASSLLMLDAAGRVGISRETLVPRARAYGLGEGDVEAWLAPVSRVEIGGETIENNRLEIADFDYGADGMLLGIDFFLSHRIYVSRQQDRLYFTYEGGPVFASNREDKGAARAEAAASEPALDAAALVRRGAASFSRHDSAAALADLDRACAMGPQAACFALRGRVREASGQRAAALQDFDDALRLDPAQAEARLGRAWAREAAGDRDGAIADLDVLDETLAPQATARQEMAQLFARLELPDRASRQWDLWIAPRPDDIGVADALNGRCWMRVMLNVELARALEDCERALAREPENASFLDSRGWGRLRLRRYAEAVADFDRSLKIEPGRAWPLYGRGIARLRQADVAGAQADLEAARRARPTIDADAGHYGIRPDVDAPAAAK